MTPFTLGRMRHLDLLTLWFRLHPPGTTGTGGSSDYLVAAMTHDSLAALLLGSP
jgi:hypothetical protein